MLTSLKSASVIESLMTLIYNTAGSINGYDEYGHYVRARLATTVCQSFRVKNDINCNANFVSGSGSASAASPAKAPAAATAAPQPVAATPAPQKAGTPSTGAAAPHKPSTKPADPQSARALLDYLLGK